MELIINQLWSAWRALVRVGDPAYCEYILSSPAEEIDFWGEMVQYWLRRLTQTDVLDQITFLD